MPATPLLVSTRPTNLGTATGIAGMSNTLLQSSGSGGTADGVAAIGLMRPASSGGFGIAEGIAAMSLAGLIASGGAGTADGVASAVTYLESVPSISTGGSGTADGIAAMVFVINYPEAPPPPSPFRVRAATTLQGGSVAGAGMHGGSRQAIGGSGGGA